MRYLIADRGSKDAEYKLAQSGDATCNGLDSAEVCVKSILKCLANVKILKCSAV